MQRSAMHSGEELAWFDQAPEPTAGVTGIGSSRPDATRA